MSFPFRYEMGSPGVFEEIVNSSDDGWYFERNIWLTTISLPDYAVEYIVIANKLNLIHQCICE